MNSGIQYNNVWSQSIRTRELESVLQAHYSNSSLESYRSALVDRVDRLEEESAQIAGIVDRVSETANLYVNHGFLKFLEKTGVFSGYAKRKMSESNGGAVKDLESRCRKNQSNLDKILRRWINDHDAIINDMNDLSKQLYVTVEQRHYLTNQKEQLQQQLTMCNARFIGSTNLDKHTLAGTVLEKQIRDYETKMAVMETQLDVQNHIIVEAKSVMTGYMTYARQLESRIKAVGPLLESKKFTLEYMSRMNLNPSQLQKQISTIAKGLQDYAAHAHLANETVLALSEMSHVATQIAQKFEFQTFDSAVLKLANAHNADALRIVERMKNSKSSIVDQYLYGTAGPGIEEWKMSKGTPHQEDENSLIVSN